MSNNIYDILAKFPKDVPTSSSEAEPIYESVDPHSELNEAIDRLTEKFDRYKSADDDGAKYLNPQAKRFVQLAKAKFPETSSDLEAVVAAIGDKTEELDKKDRETADWISSAKATINHQQKEIEDTEQAVNDANARYDAQEKRFQDFNRQVAAAELDVKQQAQAALDYAKQPEAKPQDIISKTQATAPKQPQAKAPPVAATQPKNVVQFPSAPAAEPAAPEQPSATDTTPPPEQGNEKSADKGNVIQFPNVAAPSDSEEDDSEEEKKYGTYGESMNQNKKIIKEDRREGDPLLGTENWGLISQGYNKALDQVVLSFAGNKLPITAPQMFGLVQVFNGMEPESKEMFVRKSLAFFNSTMQLLSSPQVVKAQDAFPEYQAKNQVWQRKLASTAKKYNPKQLDFFGTPNMSENIKNIAESLMERFMSFKEEAKPDFLDLDKDGDTEEPMKSAAKSAKDAEPAKPDADAVAKRKRLQALKDKQEDERAEKGDYDSKSSTRVVKGRAYGGAAQKDTEEKDDLDEVSYSAKAARAGKDIGKPGKAFAKIAKSAGERYGSKERGEKVAGAVLAKLRHGEELDEGKMKDIYTDMTAHCDKKGYSSHKEFTPADYDELGKKHGISGKDLAVALGHKKASHVAEVAPPGAKAERMVKHIKKGYAKDGKLTKREKGIAYATAWKAKKAGKLEESRNHESSEYTYETVGRILCDEQPHLDCNSEAFVKAVYDELIEMKMTPKAARWLCHYDEDFLSDCATSYSHFCKSKEKEMAECGAPMNSFVSEEPMLDAVQELDEIARLAGLAPKMEAKCSSCGCADCKCNEGMETCKECGMMEDKCSCTHESMVDESAINEAATRKDFRQVAELLKNIEDVAKRTELAMHHAEIFKGQNPRFKKEMFLAAAGVDTTPIKDESVETEGNAFTGKLASTEKGGEFELGGKKFKDTSDLEEETATEGNEFSGALAKAKAAGEKEFEVDGKKYTVKEDINLNVSATGEEDVVNLIRKLSGMPVVAIQAQPAVAEEVVAEEGPKERDVEHTNTPREEVAGTDAAIPSGNGDDRAKKMYSKEYMGDNHMAVKEEALWKAYESMINDVKA